MRGDTGANGPKGDKGDQGNKGDKGDTGATGSPGTQGAPGAQGPTGAGFLFKGAFDPAATYQTNDVVTESGGSFILVAGPQSGVDPSASVTANAGIWATLATHGDKGQDGAPGPQGIQGLPGAQGPQGQTGPIGAQGSQGLTGPIGAQGSQGLTGATGATGAQGPQGLTGATGAQGPQGLTGVTGATGATGAQGPQGQTGAQGPQGVPGPQGPAGPSGTLPSQITVSNGFVGISNPNPGEILDVGGNIRSTGSVFWGNGLTRTETQDDAGAQGNAGARSGFFETSNPTPAGNWYPNVTGSGIWQHLIEARHSNNANNYALQIAGSFFDQDLWYRKTNNSPQSTWMQIVAAGPRHCTAPFNSIGATTNSVVGGIARSNATCATPSLGGLNFNDAESVCFAQGGHIATANEIYRLAQANGLGVTVANGDWIGQSAGAGQALYVTSASDINNFEGTAAKSQVRSFRCVSTSTFTP
jgi:hypothetical protein